MCQSKSFLHAPCFSQSTSIRVVSAAGRRVILRPIIAGANDVVAVVTVLFLAHTGRPVAVSACSAAAGVGSARILAITTAPAKDRTSLRGQSLQLIRRGGVQRRQQQSDRQTDRHGVMARLSNIGNH